MSTYHAISSNEMYGFLTPKGFVRIQIPGTYEEVYSRQVKGKPGLEVRVYTSISSGGARTVGADAIRLVIFSTQHSRGVGSEARVYRTTHWNKNLLERLRDIYVQATKGLMQCECGAWMVQREGKHGKFLGCVRYPACRETKRMEAPNVGH